MHCGVRVHRPEPLAVGRVRGRLVPQHRRRSPQPGEHVVREAVGEAVEVGEVDAGEIGLGASATRSF